MVSSPECNWSFAEVLLGALAHTTPDTVEALLRLESGGPFVCEHTKTAFFVVVLRFCAMLRAVKACCVAVATCKLHLDLACFRQECGSTINPFKILKWGINAEDLKPWMDSSTDPAISPRSK